MTKGIDFTVAGEDEVRVRDLAHQMLDAIRLIVAKSYAESAAGQEAGPLAREMAVTDLAVQTLFMADYLKGDGKVAKVKTAGSPVFTARMLGIASGLGQIIGTTPDPLAVAFDLSSVKSTMDKAAAKRCAVSMAMLAKMKREGGL